MNATRMPSGRWRSKIYIGTVDGKKKYISVTADTKKDCLIKAAKAKEDLNLDAPKLTVDQAVTRYVETKRGVLSPATVAGYLSKQRLYITPYPISSVRLDQLTPQKMQAWISAVAGNVSKKTVANAYGILVASVRMFVPKADLAVRLPQGKKYGGYVPSTEEVVILLQAAKQYDERLYRACLLSAFGTLRRGEICCLTSDDIHGEILHVEKDMVKDEHGKWIVKLPKTEDSIRDVRLPQWIINEMPKGRLVDYVPDEITKWFVKVLKETGLPHFRFHDLRKHAVSLMATQGVSMASIKDIGGWSNLQTPQQIYIKALADAKQRELDQYVAFVDGISRKL